MDYQRALQQKYLFLLDNIPATDVIEYLYQEQWITHADKEIIEEPKGERQRTKRLLDKLLVKPPDAFHAFLHALKETRTDHVVHELNKKLADIRQEDKGEQPIKAIYGFVGFFMYM